MKKLSLFAAGLLFSAGVLAGAADNVAVQDPYVRLAPPNAPATGAFMVIKNNGDKDIKVVKAANPVSKVTELHTHLNEGGVMKMRPVQAIDIKAKGEAVLKPGGLHVMLIDLKAPMKEGDVVPITLTFDDGSSKQVDAKVVRPMAAGMPMGEHKH
ncbi:copper chaperone PCu(A)C [Dechloromonas agitata]|uniref:Copper chaperone PCu(A)C n=1 Tax=Dechloromonas agitata TaxID=73030 RepID=A0A930BU57_9RHOO|nr:copper chaperone PCu(A)C [Dechloromonas agitata]MBF1165744.1 copper chaperone PCu(A)C [Dechloromonas agitata]MDE1545231.1 copper chaperone PCu(A)C [Dechloromonas agitata]